MNKQNRSRLLDMQNKQVIARGERGGVKKEIYEVD